MSSLPEIGTEVRYIGRPDGEKSSGEYLNPESVPFGFGASVPDSEIAWIVGGCTGRVVKHGKGYAAHRCPDHKKAPDCICGNPYDGEIDAMPDWAVIAWESDHEGRTLERCIDLENEGDQWERVK